MAVQAGKDLLVKVDMTSDGQFETIAGLRATRVSFNAEIVESVYEHHLGSHGICYLHDAGGCPDRPEPCNQQVCV